MSKNFSKISASEFKRYLSGKMTSAEKQSFEAFIEKDEFAKEALDGYISMENNKRAADFIEKSIAATSKKMGLQELESKTPAISIYKSLSIAAVFVLIIGGFWISYSLLNKGNDTLAKNEILEKEEIIQEEPPIQQAEEEVLEADSELEAENEDLVEQEEKSLILDDSPTQKDVSTKVDAIANNSKKVSKTLPQEAPKPSASNEAFSSDEVVISKNNTRSETRTIQTEDFEEIDSEDLSSNYDKAYENFQSGNFIEASNYFEASLKEKNKPTESMYYLGLSNFYLKDYNKAINNFDQVIQSNGKSFKYNAMWYKADILIKKGNRKAAKKLLIEISESNSLFKDQAIKLLEKL